MKGLPFTAALLCLTTVVATAGAPPVLTVTGRIAPTSQAVGQANLKFSFYDAVTGVLAEQAVARVPYQQGVYATALHVPGLRPGREYLPVVEAASALRELLVAQIGIGGNHLRFIILQDSTPGNAQPGNANIVGTFIAGQFQGAGALITGLNATNIASGTLADARLSANVATLGGAQTFTGAKTFSTAPTFSATIPFNVTSAQRVANLNADLLDGLDSTAFLRSTLPIDLSGSIPGSFLMQVTNSSTGEGATAIRGVASGTGGSRLYGLWGETKSSTGYGVLGYASGTTAGTGIWALAPATNGVGILAQGHRFGVQAAPMAAQGAALQASDFAGTSKATLASAGMGVLAEVPANGVAMRATNAGTGESVDIAGPNGALVATGHVKRRYKPNVVAPATPIAYGVINANGIVLSGTGNFTATYDTTKRWYEIRIENVDYVLYDAVAVVTAWPPGVNVCPTLDSFDGMLTVTMVLSNGGYISRGFAFTVFHPDPQPPGAVSYPDTRGLTDGQFAERHPEVVERFMEELTRKRSEKLQGPRR